MRSERALFIDATRGTAMLFVLVAHFVWIYFELNQGHEVLAARLTTAMQIASPTFMLISGLMLGFLYSVRGGGIRKLGAKLVDRGLFLLLVGHVAISTAYVSYAGGWGEAFRYSQITDAIAVAIIVGPALITRTSGSTRALIACFLFVLSWVSIVAWHPEMTAALWLKDTLVGTESGRYSRWAYNFPIVPWLALYVGATVLGERVGVLYRIGDARRLARCLLVFSAAALALTVVLKGAALLARTVDVGMVLPFETELVAFTNSAQKRPPSAAYFAFNSGLGIALLAAIFWIERGGYGRRLLNLMSTLGQNSLFVFLFQEYVFVTALWWLKPPYTVFWPVLLIACVLFIVAVTLVWHRLGGGGLLTVGYGRAWGSGLDLDVVHRQ